MRHRYDAGNPAHGNLGLLLTRAPSLGIGIGIELNPVRANGMCQHHGGRISVHEEADPHTQRLGLRNDRSQALAVLRQIPPMVAGELAFAVWHQRALMGSQGLHETHQILKRIAFDVEFTIRPAPDQARQFMHIRTANMAFVWPRMNRDAAGTLRETDVSCARQRRNTQVAGIAHQRDLVQIDG